jgi:hypothetical protein
MAEDRLAARSRTRFIYAPARFWHKYRLKRQRLQRAAWEANLRGEDRIAAMSYDQRFPADACRMLPTRLGNAIRAFESHADARYGLDGALVWPRIEMLLSEEERAVINDTRTDVAFFLNCALAVFVLSTWILVDHVVAHPNMDSVEVLFVELPTWVWWLAATVVAAVPVYRTSRLLAVTAAYRWGTPTRAAVDLHRLELYDRLGLRRPTTTDDERALSLAVNRWLGSGENPPNGLRAASSEATGPPPPERPPG